MSLSSSLSGTKAEPYPALKPKQIIIVLLLAAFYLLLSSYLLGFKTEQLVISSLFVGLYLLSKPTRRFALAFSIFIVYWIIFNYMKAFPNYWVNSVHIADLYAREKQHFGMLLNGVMVTPNEYWRANHNTFLDILTGFFYLCWVPVPMLFGVLLFFKKREAYFRFALTFLLVNLIGFVVYYVYPAAPPWYVQDFGFTFHPNTPGSTAGLHRFDDYFGVGIFKSLYEHSSNVFAAMPSLHSSYPLIVLYYSMRNGMKWWLNLFFAIVTGGIWFAAVYTSHHYVMDVLAGISCALLGIGVFQLMLKTDRMKRFMAVLMQATAPAKKVKKSAVSVSFHFTKVS